VFGAGTARKDVTQPSQLRTWPRCQQQRALHLVHAASKSYAFALPTHSCGALTPQHSGARVVLGGWIEAKRILTNVNKKQRDGDHTHVLVFIVLRDGQGKTQVKLEIPIEDSETLKRISDLPLESTVSVSGVVHERPTGQANKDMTTGAIEVVAEQLQVLNESTELPFSMNLKELLNEETRLKYRYLDLRRPHMQHNIRTRSRVVQSVRETLIERGFFEIETPTLFRTTSEGAREYIVPTRERGHFYSLVQSPQQYKQLLMMSGFERYFQLARCYRDEDLRADRQPEFTQVDLELAFADARTVQDVIEHLVAVLWRKFLNIELALPFKRVTYRECLDKYGSDKPDTRYELQLCNVTHLLRDTRAEMFRSALVDGGTVRALRIPHLGPQMTRVMEEIKQRGVEHVTAVRVVADGQWKSSLTKHVTAAEMSALNKEIGAQEGDIIFFSAGLGDDPLNDLGKVRVHCSQELIKRGLLSLSEQPYHFFWVVDFPLFTLEDGVVKATHHPFTAPVPEDAALLEQWRGHSTDPKAIHKLPVIRGQHYDLVLNGMEIGGGSIRIHQAADQLTVLKDVLLLSDRKVSEFNHLLTALGHGAPPHGGIALGLDRLLSIMLNAPSLRDVIAFPKSNKGNELMTGSPGELTNEELLAYNLQLAPIKESK
jgi:aspartyl-tRNA synthetase